MLLRSSSLETLGRFEGFERTCATLVASSEDIDDSPVAIGPAVRLEASGTAFK